MIKTRKSTNVPSIVRQYSEGRTAQSIARLEGLTTSTVLRHLRDQGVEVKKAVKKSGTSKLWDTLPAFEIIAQYQQGHSASSIAEMYSVNSGTIIQLLKHHGIEVRNKEDAQYNRRLATLRKIEPYIEAYNNGMSLRAIAEAYHVSAGGLWSTFKRFNLLRKKES